MANKKASADTVRTGIEEITTQGDLLYRGATDLKHLPKGSSGQQLSMGNSNEPEWITVADELPAAGTSGNLLTSTGSAWASTAPTAAGFTLLGAKIATTSGSTISITGIPADVSMVILGFMGVSTVNYGIDVFVQLGIASGLVTSGYLSGSVRLRSGSSYSYFIDQADASTNFIIRAHDTNANTWNGQMIFTRMDSSTDAWVSSHSMYNAPYRENTGGGYHADLGGALTQISLTSGGHAFDAGHLNVSYI